MFSKRSTRRAIAIVSLLFALIPSAASARPLYDRQPEPSHAEPTPLVRQISTDGADQTLALVISSAALLLAAFAAARTTNVRRVAQR